MARKRTVRRVLSPAAATLPLILITAFAASRLVAANAASFIASQAHTSPAQPVKTIWAGVYTTAQANRGGRAYIDTCSRCHGADLSGSDQGPRLVGAPFFDRWHDFRLRWLFENVRFAMPHDFTVFVTADSAADIVSFLLEQNGAPAGRDELTPTVDALEEILITKPRGETAR